MLGAFKHVFNNQNAFFISFKACESECDCENKHVKVREMTKEIVYE